MSDDITATTPTPDRSDAAGDAPRFDRRRYEAQRSQAMRDIEEVRLQVEAGELDGATAAELTDRYEAELADADAHLDRHQTVELSSGADESIDPVPGPGVLSRRRLVGAAVLAVALVAAGVLASRAIEPRQGGFITGGPEQGVNLDDVTNDQMEAVIAANPDIPEVALMRRALANRYFEEGDYSSALPHYLDALAGNIAGADRAQALGRVGWMSFLSGRADLAVSYLDESLAVEPDYAEGVFFYGLVLLYGQDDATAALPFLQQTAARDDLPDDIRAEVESALADAAASLEDGASFEDGAIEEGS